MGRILYLDENGVTTDEEADPYMIVAGVLVHTDNEWREVRDAIQKLADDWLPPADRPGFIFHARDLYHGSKYWDREVWPAEIRGQILIELIGIITGQLRLPIFAQFVEKKTFGIGKAVGMQGTCTLDCVIWADKWLARFAPDENATATAENNDDVKQVIRAMQVVLQHPELMVAHGLDGTKDLPLKRIIDGVSFQNKQEAVALQLADACCFVLKRGYSGKHIPPNLFFQVLGRVYAGRGYDRKKFDKLMGEQKQRVYAES